MNIKMKMRSFFLIHTLLFWRKKKDERWTKKENHYENSIRILMNESLKMQKVNVFSLEASKHKKFKRYSTYVHSRTSMPGRF